MVHAKIFIGDIFWFKKQSIPQPTYTIPFLNFSVYCLSPWKVVLLLILMHIGTVGSVVSCGHLWIS
uniref:Uncharacterized protein n=1 Tax=Arundo donax TaxID=35708 RepID=A0A0A8ZJS7_ARUDO